MSWVKVPIKDDGHSDQQIEFTRLMDASNMPYCRECLRAECVHWIVMLPDGSDPEDFHYYCSYECLLSNVASIVECTLEEQDPAWQWEWSDG